MSDSEKKSGMFAGMRDVLKTTRAAPTPDADSTDASATSAPSTATMRSEPNAPARGSRESVAPRASRPPARATSITTPRRSNAAFTQISAYVATDLYGDVRKHLIQHPRHKEMGALLDELFARWLKDGAQ